MQGCHELCGEGFAEGHSSFLVLRVLHNRFINRHRSLRHHVHRVASRKQRQLLQAHLHYDDLGDGLFDLLLELFDGLWVHSS